MVALSRPQGSPEFPESGDLKFVVLEPRGAARNGTAIGLIMRRSLPKSTNTLRIAALAALGEAACLKPYRHMDDCLSH